MKTMNFAIGADCNGYLKRRYATPIPIRMTKSPKLFKYAGINQKARRHVQMLEGPEGNIQHSSSALVHCSVELILPSGISLLAHRIAAGAGE
jgi:hypothetical protein